jgi:uncharacterized protein
MRRIAAAAVVWLAAFFWVGAATAAPTFPALTGRVVDQAGVLSPQAEAAITAKLEALETGTGRQLVVVTLPSLQGLPIEDYGYQLGRHWGIGQKAENNGALFIVAPNDREVRIEVGYGLEPVLTDALSSVIIQSAVLPRFRAGDIEGGVTAGTDAIVQQLSLPDGEAKARVQQAAARPAPEDSNPFPIIITIFILIMVFHRMIGGRRRGGLLPWIILGGLGGGGRGGGWSSGGGGGWSSGGGGFSGGGGSFGGGGASGRW